MHTRKPFFLNHRIVLLLFACALVVYGISCYQRLSEYRYWQEESEVYKAGQVTGLSGMDGYYWLKMARELDEGRLGKGQVDSNRGYPDGVPFALNDTPNLLVVLISLGTHLTGGDYYRSGLMLIWILAGLFVFPLFFYCHKLGFGASAVLGGLVGSFGHAYYDRTMMGRVDTDLLNTFFPLAAACFILPMHREKSWRANLGLALGAGLAMYLFSWWYQVPAFILVYLCVMAAHLLIGRLPWQRVVPLLLVYLLASGPQYVWQSVESLRVILWAYVSPPPMGQIVWPDVLKTVAEAQIRGVSDKLEMMHGFLPIVFAGFAGLLYLIVARFKQMIPLAPLLILGGWSLMGPSRFVMYLQPLIGVGCGVLIELLVNFAGKKITLKPMVASIAAISLMGILFFSTSGATGFPFHTEPLLKAPVLRDLLRIKQIVPKHSAIFTPYWEYGYILMEVGDFATYHDGGMQGGMRSTLAAKAMTSTRQQEMVSLLSYLEEYGFNHLSAKVGKGDMTADQMMAEVLQYPGEFRGENVYVLYLEDMIWKVAAMSYFSEWDFAQKKSETMDYVQLHCFSSANDIMTCRDGTIDLNQGLMNDGSTDIPLNAALFVNDGYVVEQRDYRNDRDGFYLQVLMRNNDIYMILVAEQRLFLSNFNQQYLLGNYDRRYFEEVYNNFPMTRVLKVKKADN